MRNKTANTDSLGDEYGKYLSDDYLFISGSEIFLFTFALVFRIIANTIKKIIYQRKILICAFLFKPIISC
jgi:hypothetical protein